MKDASPMFSGMHLRLGTGAKISEEKSLKLE